MRALLESRNRVLLTDLEAISSDLAHADIPAELESYRQRIGSLCAGLVRQCQRNLGDLARGRDDLLEDLLSSTQQTAQFVRLLSARFLAPVLRASANDRLSLKTIAWLHRNHPATAKLPAAFADGPCGVWPLVEVAPIYFFPSTEQHGLLYQPLYFHEFGHLLYRCHKNEMDDLVRELQKSIEQLLRPPAQRNDRHATVQADERRAIAERWYAWAQEFFCDAVGLTIGGPCFLRAFSGHLGTMHRGDFYQGPDDLRQSTHPVTWLRVKILVERAKGSGFEEAARDVKDEWRLVAATMRITEDYHGFYAPPFQSTLTQILDDMLTEADPRHCSAQEAKGEPSDSDDDPFPSILNAGWNVYLQHRDQYADWENETKRLLMR